MARIAPTYVNTNTQALSSAGTSITFFSTAYDAPVNQDDYIVIFLAIDGSFGISPTILLNSAVLTQGEHFVSDYEIANDTSYLFIAVRRWDFPGPSTYVVEWAHGDEKAAGRMYEIRGVDRAHTPTNAGGNFIGPGWSLTFDAAVISDTETPQSVVDGDNPYYFGAVGFPRADGDITAPPTGTALYDVIDTAPIAAGGGGGANTKPSLWSCAASTDVPDGSSMWGHNGGGTLFSWDDGGNTVYVWEAYFYGIEDTPSNEHNLLTDNLETPNEIQEGNYVDVEEGWVSWPDNDLRIDDNIQTDISTTPAPGTIYPRLIDSDQSSWVATIDDRQPSTVYSCNVTDNKVVDASSVDGLSASIYCGLSGVWSNDILSVNLRVFQQDGVTPLTDLAQITTAEELAGVPDNVGTFSVAFTGVDPNPANWASAQVWIQWEYSRTGGADGIYILVAELRLYGQYTPNVYLDLTAGSLESTQEIQSGAIEIANNLTAQHLEQGNEIQSAGLTAEHILGTGTALEAPTEIQQASINQTLDLAAGSLEAAGEIQSGALDQAFDLAAGSLEATGEIQSGAVDSESNVTAASLEQVNEIQEVSMTGYARHAAIVRIEALGLRLSAGSLLEEGYIQSGDLDQEHNLAALSLEARHTIQQDRISQIHQLTRENLQTTPEIQSGAVEHLHDTLATLSLEATPEIQSAGINFDLVLEVLGLQQDNEIQLATIHAVTHLTTLSLESDQTIGSGRVTHLHDTLAAGSLEATGEIQDVSLSSEYDLRADSLAGEAEVQSGGVEQIHTLYTQHLAGANEIAGGAIFIRPHDLRTFNLEQRSDIQSGYLYRSQELLTTALEATGEIQAGTLSQDHVLVTWNLEVRNEIQSGAIRNEGDLLPLNLYQPNEISSGEIEAFHQLQVLNLEAVPEIQEGLILTEQDLSTDNWALVGEIQSGRILDQIHKLVALNLDQLNEIQSGEVYFGALEGECPALYDISVQYHIVERRVLLHISDRSVTYHLHDCCSQGCA